MKIIKITVSMFVLALILACGWDWDTVKMEKQAFPQIHELITGKFYRHSPELYYWRIKDRTEKLKRSPDSLNAYDDLAMAYDKTGEPGKAIGIMLQKEKIKPGLYETYANLGLFYMHNNEMEKGVEYVKKALKVNPNAHFGREKYQLHLGNYILSREKNGKPQLPLSPGKTTGFYTYLQQHEFKVKDEHSPEHFTELANAIKGVAGMMTFANYRSPVLLEALGDLLLHTKSVRGAGHLASRAYLKASWETDSAMAKAYLEKARWAREYNYYMIGIPMEDLDLMSEKAPTEIRDSIEGRVMARPLFTMKELETALKYEVQSAETWFDSVRTNEIGWIKAGKNPDTEFDKKYYRGTELKNVAVDVYGAGAVKNRVDNQKWLAQQLNKPQDIRNIHGFNRLPDSVKQELDSIYAREFKSETPAKVQAGHAKNNRGNPSIENQKTNALWIYAGVGAGMLLLLGGYFLRRKRKGSAE